MDKEITKMAHDHQEHEQQQKVELSLSLNTSPPHTISINDTDPSKPLRLIAPIIQKSSPFTDRPITILTKYTYLDADAFFLRTMKSPQISNPDPQCPAPELPLRPVGKWITAIRVSGDPDLLRCPESDGFSFITIPPVGRGHTEVVFELHPAKLVQRLGDKGESLSDKLLRFLRPGDTYKVAPSYWKIPWWTFGSLEGESGLKTKKIARWTLPDTLSLKRQPGEDETDEVAHQLKDFVDLHNVGRLSSRSAIDGEKRPDIGKMRREGWVFGEPEAELDCRCGGGKEAYLTITA